jgi:uncharacterized protein YaaR (DUF327 family)
MQRLGRNRFYEKQIETAEINKFQESLAPKGERNQVMEKLNSLLRSLQEKGARLERAPSY